MNTNRVATVAFVISLAVLFAGPSECADLDFHGGAGMGIGRADNPEFLDPNSPVSSRRSDYSGGLSLRGAFTATWQRTTFDIDYSPTASFFYDRSDLNSVSHSLTSTWKHDYSPRASLTLNETLSYTPEQDVDPTQLQGNTVITRRSTRTTSNFRGNYNFQKSAKTTLGVSYRYLERAFGSDDYIDSSDNSLGFQWRREVSARTFVQSGYQAGVFSFKGRFDGSMTHRVFSGWGYSSPGGFNLALNAGYNILLPDDPNQDTSRGTTIDASTGWSGRTVGLNAGHSRGFSGGAGAFSSSENLNTYGNLQLTISPRVSADLAVTSNVNKRLGNSATVATSDETIRSLNGRSLVRWKLNDQWSVNASYSYYKQSQLSSGASIPSLRSNRYSVGAAWSFR